MKMERRGFKMPTVATAQTSETPLSELKDNKEIRRRIIDLAWPAFTEMMLINLIQMINMIMVSRVSPEAVAAVGLTAQPIQFAMALLVALNVGATAIVARAIGGGNQEEANRAAQLTFNINIWLALPLAILLTLFADPILRFMGADPLVIEEGIHYARLSFIALAFMVLTTGISAVLRGAGDTKTSAKVNVVTDIMIVGAGLPLIYGWFGLPQLGILGAGLSTLAARIIAAVWMVGGIFAGKKKIQLVVSRIGIFDRTLLRRILKIGLPSMGESFVIRFGQILLTILIAGLGTSVFAANQIAFNILGLTWLPALALSTAASTLVGQGLGAKNPDLAEKFGWQTNKYAMIMMGVCGVGFILFAKWILLLYTSDPEIIRLGTTAMQVIGATQVFQAAQYVLAGALRGAGDTKYSLKVTFFGVWAVRVTLTALFLFVFKWGLLGAWLAIAIDQIFRSTLLFIRFRRGEWKKINV